MKIYRLFLFLSFLWLQACNSVSGPVHFYPGEPRSNSETARLKVPAEITVISIDGKETKVPSKDEGFYEIFLLPGLHRVDFKYGLAWGDNVSGMFIRSKPIGIETQFYAGKNYEITYSKPTEQEEAYEMIMASQFRATLIEKETGRKVASRTTVELDEFRLTSSSVDGKAAVAQPAVNPVTVNNTVPEDINAETAAREDAVKRLKFWWLMANEKERKLFKEWMKSVESVK